jgi:hypothetical protein
MNKKGQIFSLDFILSLVVVIALLALLFQVFEVTAYEAKQQQVQRELMVVGELASERLVTDESIACRLVDDNNNFLPGFELVNCINTSRLAALNKGLIGIPFDFNCQVDGLALSGCTDGSPPTEVRDVFEIERRVILSPTDFNKTVFNRCVAGLACPFADTNITLRVWPI